MGPASQFLPANRNSVLTAKFGVIDSLALRFPRRNRVPDRDPSAGFVFRAENYLDFQGLQLVRIEWLLAHRSFRGWNNG